MVDARIGYRWAAPRKQYTTCSCIANTLFPLFLSHERASPSKRRQFDIPATAGAFDLNELLLLGNCFTTQRRVEPRSREKECL